MGKDFQKWSFGIKSACAGVIFFMAFIFMMMVTPPLDKLIFGPVVSKLNIERIIDNGDGTANVYASFRKLRECEYVGIAWFRGQPDGLFERVSLILNRAAGDTSSPNRPVGYQKSGPWTVGMPAAEIEKGSFVRLTHRCYPFFMTTTDFYP